MSINQWKKTFCGMPKSKRYYKVFKDTDLLAQVELYYAHYLNHKKDAYFIEQMEDLVERSREVRFKMKDEPKFIWYESQYEPLGNCEAATPCTYAIPKAGYAVPAIQEKGNNPMRIENTSATAYVTAPKSDDAISREYLLSRLEGMDYWHAPKIRELMKLFKIGERGMPKTYQQLIDAIKGDKFTLDAKKVRKLKELEDDVSDEEDGLDEDYYGYGPFYGLVFTDLPKADSKGYEDAITEFNKQIKATKDTIMVASPADGLKALQALEAWLPVGKAS